MSFQNLCNLRRTFESVRSVEQSRVKIDNHGSYTAVLRYGCTRSQLLGPCVQP